MSSSLPIMSASSGLALRQTDASTRWLWTASGGETNDGDLTGGAQRQQSEEHIDKTTHRNDQLSQEIFTAHCHGGECKGEIGEHH
jgi:hypothetical protein